MAVSRIVNELGTSLLLSETFSNLAGAPATYYYPATTSCPYVVLGPAKHFSLGLVATCAAGNTLTFTLETSVDASTWFDVTVSAVDAITGVAGAATYPCPAAGSIKHKLDLDFVDAIYLRVKTVVNDGGGANNSGELHFYWS